MLGKENINLNFKKRFACLHAMVDTKIFLLPFLLHRLHKVGVGVLTMLVSCQMLRPLMVVRQPPFTILTIHSLNINCSILGAYVGTHEDDGQNHHGNILGAVLEPEWLRICEYTYMANYNTITNTNTIFFGTKQIIRVLIINQ